MQMKLISWDGHNINDGTNYEAAIHPAVAMPAATATFIDVGKGDPVLAGKVMDGGYFTFTIVIKGSSVTLRDELNKWFRTNDYVFRKLLGYDLGNGNKAWYLEGYPVTPPMLAEGSSTKYTITLALSSPYWIENDLNTNTWQITADTETEVMANVGNVAALPKIAITPNSAKGSNQFAYKQFCAIKVGDWGSGYGAYGACPLDIVNGSLDTAALITAGKMLSNGYDLQVIDERGNMRERWLGNFNTANTKVWVQVGSLATPPMVLVTSLDGSTTPASIVVTYSGTITPQISANGLLQIGTELITYSTVVINSVAMTITFTPVTRGAKGSTKASHSPGVSVYWAYGLWLVYGNSSAQAQWWDLVTPVTHVIDVDDSTNTKWVFKKFSPESSGAAGNGSASQPYMSGGGYRYVVANDASPDEYPMPYAVVGIKLKSLYYGSGSVIPVGEQPKWTFLHTGGISGITVVGEKYRNSASYGVIRFGTMKDSIEYYYTEPPATVADVWEDIDFTHDFGVYLSRVNFQMKGPLGTTLPVPYEAAEISYLEMTVRTLEVTVIGAEQVAYTLNGTIENDGTGDIVKMNNLITKTAETITIDCDSKEVYSTDGKRIRSALSFEGIVRDEWLTLEPGNNSIIWLDVGTSNVTVVTTWRARNTI